MKLIIELVPETAWRQSLHNLLPRDLWNNIRADIIKQNGYKCQICGETRGTMELHEVWSYDDLNQVQKLDHFFLICNVCHHVKHIGLAGKLARQGKLDLNKVIEHFCRVNNCTREEYEQHVKEAFDTWRKRSAHGWKQDFGEYRYRMNIY